MAKQLSGIKNFQRLGMTIRKRAIDEGTRIGIPDYGLQDTGLDIGFCARQMFQYSHELSPMDAHDALESAVTISDMGELGHLLVRWVGFGFPVFHLTHSLAASLVLTNPRGVTWGDMRFPFSSFIIQMPRPKGVMVYEGSKGRREVDYISINETSRYSNSPTLAVLARHSNDVEKMRADIHTNGKTMVSMVLSTWDGDCFLHHNAFRDSDDHAIDTWMSNSKQGLLPSLEMESIDSDALAAGRRLVANLCLYLANLGPQESWPKVRSKPSWNRKKQGEVPEPSVWIIGREIKLGPHMLAAARSDTDRKGWELAQRFMVRGHWRRQACGPGMKERRLKWIAPYWKGPESATAALTRLYSAQDEIVKETKT
jgi:hypothetical protein